MAKRVFRAKIVYIASPKELKASFLALVPESSNQPSGKMNVNIVGNSLIIELEAESFSVLRAMVASCIRMIKCFIKMTK